MLTTADLTVEERWEVLTTLDLCRAGMLRTTETGYATVDFVAAPCTDHRELIDRLIDFHLITIGQPSHARLEDGTCTTAELHLTVAGEWFRHQLTLALAAW